MKCVLQENRKNKKYEGNKNIGLSEMHNMFVAADEEKRKALFKILQKRKYGAMFTSELKYVHIRTRRWLSNPMLEDSVSQCH